MLAIQNERKDMRYKLVLQWLVPPIVILTLLAAGLGLFYQKEGQPFIYTNHRGETVTINGQGLYYFDTVSMAAQTQGNDLVTLVLGVPLLIVSAYLAWHGSLRGQLLLTGTLGFILYTHMSMACLAAYNFLFLGYVALFTLSLYAFIFSLMSFDLRQLPQRFSARLPRGWIATFLFIEGGFLLIAWLGRILRPLMAGQDPVLENTTSLVIQFMDLSLIVPAAFLSGVLLLKEKAWGYLLSAVVLLKGVTLSLAVSAMAINMARRGVPESLGIVIPFFSFAILNVFFAITLLRHVKPMES
jgi:hypothetical protein